MLKKEKSKTIKIANYTPENPTDISLLHVHFYCRPIQEEKFRKKKQRYLVITTRITATRTEKGKEIAVGGII